MSPTETLPDALVGEFIDLARSANIHFDIVNDRLHMRMVNPDWAMWKPCRHLLDEIGQARIETYVRGQNAGVVERWTQASAARLHLAVEAMR